SSNNPKYPSVDKVYGYLRSKEGIMDDAGNIIDEVLVKPETIKKATALGQEASQYTTNAPEVQAGIEQASSDWDWYNPFTWGGKAKEFDSPTFGKIKVKKDGDKYIVETANKTYKGDEAIPESQLIPFLAKLGV